MFIIIWKSFDAICQMIKFRSARKIRLSHWIFSKTVFTKKHLSSNGLLDRVCQKNKIKSLQSFIANKHAQSSNASFYMLVFGKFPCKLPLPSSPSYSHAFRNSVTFLFKRERDIDRKVARDTKMERASSIPYFLMGQKSKEEKKLNR